MNLQQKIVNILSISRKADKIVLGFDPVKSATQDGSVSCVVVTDDASEKTLKEVNFFCNNCNTDVVELEISSFDMYDVVGKRVVVAAISDHGLAEKIKELGKIKKPPTKRKSREKHTES